MADFLLLARALMRDNGGDAASGGTPGTTAPPNRGPLPKEQKKFYKLGNPPAAPVAEAPAAPMLPASPDAKPPTLPPVSAPAENKPDGAPASAPAAAAESPVKAERPTPRPGRFPLGPMEERTPGRRRSLGVRQRTVLIGLGVLSTVGAFLLGLYVGGATRPATPKAPAAITAAAPVAPGQAAPVPEATTGSPATARALMPDEALRRALVTIDQAEAAHGVGDWARMGTLLEQAEREAGPLGVPGLLFRRAENAARRGDAPTANALAQRSTDAGEELAKAHALRAVLAQRSKRPLIALSLLEAAGRLDPFDGRYPYYQGQTLRAQGKLQEAAIRLRRALDRAEEPAQVENYGLSLRLAQIELGQDESFAEELARRLAQPYPAPDWLVTAAARELQAGRTREGADFLRRALVQSSPNFAATRLGDVFFRRFADQPDMAPLFAQYLPPPAAPAAPAAPAYPPAMPTPYPSLQSPSNELIIPPLRGPEDASARPADPADNSPKQP